jgi:S-formylglutathione hydrolase FrmB
VAFYTAVPAGHGDGRGLPVCFVLHGASATAADFPRFGFGRFLSDAVARGAAPFVLAGADGGRLGWEPSGSDDPQRMVHEELPAWCGERGFDVHRLAAWGWSMGGYGVLRLAEVHPGFGRAVAAFSPAVSPGDRVFSDAASLRGTAIGLWCGRQDGFYGNVRRLEGTLPEPPRAGGYADGGHTRQYWNRITPAAFDFVAAALAA